MALGANRSHAVALAMRRALLLAGLIPARRAAHGVMGS
jgi:hypothetical protein